MGSGQRAKCVHLNRCGVEALPTHGSGSGSGRRHRGLVGEYMPWDSLHTFHDPLQS